MRVIHAGGFNKMERQQWRAIIFNNLVSAFQTIFAAMQEQDTEFEDDDNLVCRLAECQQCTRSAASNADPDSDMPNSSPQTPKLEFTTACPRSAWQRSTAYGPTRACSWPY